jgi:hypothetical protein
MVSELYFFSRNEKFYTIESLVFLCSL